jgi:hypothetical protein
MHAFAALWTPTTAPHPSRYVVQYLWEGRSGGASFVSQEAADAMAKYWTTRGATVTMIDLQETP